MASLEELLAEDGFKKGKVRQGPRSSAASRAVSMPLYPMRQRNPLYHHESANWRGPSKPNAFTRRTQSMLPESHNARRSTLRNQDSSSDGLGEDESETEELELRLSRDRRPNVLHRNSDDESQDDLESMNGYTNGEKSRSNNYKKFQVRLSFDEAGRGGRHNDPSSLSSGPALDEAAIQAVVSILTGHIRRFFKEENFRASIAHSCASCIDSGSAKDSNQKDHGLVSNLKEAIATIERAAKSTPDVRQLKKASLKLSAIVASSSLKDEYVSGIPNSDLTACANLYLSLFYKLQKKNRASAKHLLQVFCDSPYQARTTLLPALWDRLFLPHLLHLKVWYEKEVECVPRTSSRPKKMRLLEKMYNNVLDTGTCHFAAYYKDWIMVGTAAPVLPSIHAPSASMPVFPQEKFHVAGSNGVSSSDSSAPSRPIISKALYESLVSQSRTMEAVDETRGRDEEEIEEVEEEIDMEQFIAPVTKSEEIEHKSEETETLSPGSGINAEKNAYEDHWMSSSNVNASHDVLPADERTAKEYYLSSRPKIPEEKELKVGVEDTDSYPSIFRSNNAPYLIQQEKENEFTLKRLAQDFFQPQATDHQKDIDAVTLKHPVRMHEHDFHQHNLSHERFTKSELKAPGMKSVGFGHKSIKLRSSAGSYGNNEEIGKDSFVSTIPKDFLCPLTGHLFRDPVTLETGQTFERAAIEEWFNKGNQKCPVTGRALEYLSVPTTNFVLKRLIDGWKAEQCRDLLVIATQIIGSAKEQGYRAKDESALFIVEQLLTGFSKEEQMENAKHLISIGGLHFLTRRLDTGNLEEKIRIFSLLLCCIKADGSCRGYLAANIEGTWILELLHSKQAGARSNAVMLLIELICLNRRTTITSLISGLNKEAIVNTMHILLLYLHSSPSEDKALVAVLILNFDSMVEPRRYSIYREEAVDGITMALECCLSDEKLIPYTHRALLMLGGHFSSSGEPLIETWLFKQAGFSGQFYSTPVHYDDEVDEEEEETLAREEWLKNMALVLYDNGKRSFLKTLCKCLGSGNPNLVRACLTTAAWLSRAFASLSISEFQLPAFSALLPQLKEKLESGEQIEHKILASISLLNFSLIPECRVLLVKSAEDLCVPLRSLLEATSTAKQLYVTIFEEHLESKDKEGIPYSSSREIEMKELTGCRMLNGSRC